MSRSIRSQLARALGRDLVRIMPPSRAEWAMGMRAEIDAIDDPAAAFAFALGCIRVGYLQRARTMTGALMAVRWAVALATLMFSAVVLATAYRATALETPEILPQIFAGLGLAFLTAAAVLARSGPGALAAVAAIMLCLNTLALSASGQAAFVHANVHRALILEGYLLWSLLLLAGLTLRQAARSTRLVRLARENGWHD